MDLWYLIPGIAFLLAALIRLKTDWAPWPLRISTWPLRLNVSDEKKKEAERLTAVVYFLIGAVFFVVIGLGLLG